MHFLVSSLLFCRLPRVHLAGKTLHVIPAPSCKKLKKIELRPEDAPRSAHLGEASHASFGVIPKDRLISWSDLPESIACLIFQKAMQGISYIGTSWGTNDMNHSVNGAMCLTSKGFCQTLAVIKNSAAKATMAPLDLAAIKRKCLTTDLSFVHDLFYKNASKRFAASVVPGTEIDEILSHLSPTLPVHPSACESLLEAVVGIAFENKIPDMCSAVEIEYKRFMVIKCIETKQTGEGNSPWNTRCSPSSLIDEFWHAHMLHPKKYVDFCNALIKDVIDHQPGYVMDAAIQTATLASKLDAAFKYEKLLTTCFMKDDISRNSVASWAESVCAFVGDFDYDTDDYGNYDDCG